MRSADRRAVRNRQWAAALAGSAVAVVLNALPAQAAWRITPTLSEELTYTNNVDPLATAERQSDFVLSVRPGARFDYRASRANVTGTISAPILLYANTGARNNQVAPQVDVSGRFEAVKDFFFVDASATVGQTYLNPFGPRPPGLVEAQDNRYTSTIYRLAPYIQGLLGSNMRYLVRDDNVWSDAHNASGGGRLYSNLFTGTIERQPTPFGWGVEATRSEYDFGNQDHSHVMELARLRGLYRPSPILELSLSGGYERNQFAASESDGAVYGVGVRWRPTERTVLDATWEHRFFGGSYSFRFGHRTPRTAWNVRAARNISTYPQQALELPAGTLLPLLLNQILLTRIPDPVERIQYIIDFMRERNLPFILADALALDTQQINLVQSILASVAISGARNTLFFSAYRVKTEPIAGTGEALPPVQGLLNDNTQIGTTAAWTHSLTSTSSLSLTGTVSRTEANPPLSGRTDQWNVRLVVSRPLSPRSTMFAGASYQKFDSDLITPYSSAAVFVGANHSFE